eukprot:GGOE01045284.1.p3 GENE.GGOE01045284.1~~GGOE01045284.1.p3  ORF type:complete len:139 (-),score=8.96 GGOE01045284.1:588-1004(-)
MDQNEQQRPFDLGAGERDPRQCHGHLQVAVAWPFSRGRRILHIAKVQHTDSCLPWGQITTTTTTTAMLAHCLGCCQCRQGVGLPQRGQLALVSQRGWQAARLGNRQQVIPWVVCQNQQSEPLLVFLLLPAQPLALDLG